jgi:hypothetical protein
MIAVSERRPALPPRFLAYCAVLVVIALAAVAWASRGRPPLDHTHMLTNAQVLTAARAAGIPATDAPRVNVVADGTSVSVLVYRSTADALEATQRSLVLQHRSDLALETGRLTDGMQDYGGAGAAGAAPEDTGIAPAAPDGAYPAGAVPAAAMPTPGYAASSTPDPAGSVHVHTHLMGPLTPKSVIRLLTARVDALADPDIVASQECNLRVIVPMDYGSLGLDGDTPPLGAPADALLRDPRRTRDAAKRLLAATCRNRLPDPEAVLTTLTSHSSHVSWASTQTTDHLSFPFSIYLLHVDVSVFRTAAAADLAARLEIGDGIHTDGSWHDNIGPDDHSGDGRICNVRTVMHPEMTDPNGGYAPPLVPPLEYVAVRPYTDLLHRLHALCDG